MKEDKHIRVQQLMIIIILLSNRTISGTDAAYEPWYTPEGYALVEHHQEPLLMAKQEPEYQELQPMLQPLQHTQHMQQLDIEQQFPSASPAYFHEVIIIRHPYLQ